MIYCKTIVCDLNERKVVVDGENGHRAVASLAAFTEDQVSDSIALARHQRVELPGGITLPHDVYKSDFFRNMHFIGQEFQKDLHEAAKKPTTLVPHLMCDPICNNFPIDSPERDYTTSQLVSAIPDDVDIKAILENYTSFWSTKPSTMECDDFSKFIVFVNYLIRSVKEHNHLMVMGTFVYFNTEGRKPFLCFVEQNVVRISKAYDDKSDTAGEMFLCNVAHALLERNLALQKENHNLRKENDALRGRDMASYVKDIFDANVNSISGAVEKALVRPLVSALKQEIVQPILSAVEQQEVLEDERAQARLKRRKVE